MLKFIVSVLFVSFASATSDYSSRYLTGYPASVGHYPVGVGVGQYPGAVSHVSRLDFHGNKPFVSGYESPLGYGSLGYAPAYAPGNYGYGYNLGYRNPYGYGYPAAQSYSNRIDVHGSPVVNPYGHGYGGYGFHDGNGYGYAIRGYGIQGLHSGY